MIFTNIDRTARAEVQLSCALAALSHRICGNISRPYTIAADAAHRFYVLLFLRAVYHRISQSSINREQEIDEIASILHLSGNQHLEYYPSSLIT
jgi:hypothetical protein